MKVFVFGAGGILGQHMMLCKPAGIEAQYFRKTPGPLFRSIDLTDTNAVMELLDREAPNVIVNLAGESNVDEVERNAKDYVSVNVVSVRTLAGWCDLHGAHLIQVSSQSVFSGTYPPGPGLVPDPVNRYGMQKAAAEQLLSGTENMTIVRGTFCLGIRPIPSIGRESPAETMLAGKQPRQVADRWFSVMFAEDAAEQLWRVVQHRPKGIIVHLGNHERKSRYDVAKDLGCEVQPCKHEDFPGLSLRAIDTTYADGCTFTPYTVGIKNIKRAYESVQTVGFYQRARELALFFHITFDEACQKLGLGFGPLHNEVTADFNRSKPVTDDELLKWYRETEAYIWELSAYHLDAGFNYSGMCQGIGESLTTHGATNVLCLGDGIGDLTMSLRKRGMQAWYHDLNGSRTAEFAARRFWMYGTAGPSCLTGTFEPVLPKLLIENGFDAIVSLDFLEHVTCVESWVRSIYGALRPGGVACLQNAFGIGSGPEGSIPMHLERNDRFETEYDPLMAEVGFKQISSNWYIRPA